MDTVYLAYTQTVDWDDYPIGTATTVYVGTDRAKALAALDAAKTYGRQARRIEVWVNGKQDFHHDDNYRRGQ